MGRGWCSKHYTRWSRYGDPEARMPGEIRDGRKICPECGTDVALANYSPGAAYCKPCTAARKRRKIATRPVVPLPVIHCIQCGSPFQPLDMREVLCSATCRSVRRKATDRYYASRDGGESANAAGSRWQSANLQSRVQTEARRRARKASSTSIRVSTEAVAERMAYFGNKCWMCGGAFECIDHVKPLAKGGPHILANLRPACTACNSSKSDKWTGVRSVIALAA